MKHKKLQPKNQKTVTRGRLKKEKTMILNEFIRFTRHIPMLRLSNYKKRILGYPNIAGKRIKLVAGKK